MDVKLSHSFNTVLDLDEAIAFYRDVIGLEVCTDVRIGSMRWITAAAAGQPYGVEISLETPQGRPGDIDALTKVIEDGSLTAAIFETDDCDSMFARLVVSGAPVVQEPADQPYGVRDCAVRTPQGTWSASPSRCRREPRPAFTSDGRSSS
ncbi:MAG: VOC family protein [Actinomycetota bacterium]|nr:VOC family protein [Actinomycetota bacterium]